MPPEPWPVPSPNYQGSLGDYKQSVSPTRRNFARQPTYESPGDAYIRLNKNNNSFFQEVKSMLDPKNLTGANAIEAALGINGKGKGLPITQRVTSGLSGLVQGLGFAMGGEAGKVGVEGVKNTGIPARIINKVKNEEVVLHGRKTAGYSEIKPAGGKYENQPELAQYAYNYFDNPQAPNIAAPKGKSLGVEALPFAHEGGTLYAVKGPKESFTNPHGGKVDWAKDTVIKSQQNQKVVGSMPIDHAAYGNYQAQIETMLKRAGAKLPKKK